MDKNSLFFIFRSSEIPWLFWLINSELAQITFDKDQLIDKLKIKKKEKKNVIFFLMSMWNGRVGLQSNHYHQQKKGW